MENKKGFTLVELVVTIAIIGVILLIIFPSVQVLKNRNEIKKYKYYEQALKEAAKVYVDKHKLVSVSGNGGCELISIEKLKKDNLIKDFKAEDFDCETGTYVKVEKKNKKLKYIPVMKCRDNQLGKEYKSKDYDKNIISSTCAVYKTDSSYDYRYQLEMK